MTLSRYRHREHGSRAQHIAFPFFQTSPRTLSLPFQKYFNLLSASTERHGHGALRLDQVHNVEMRAHSFIPGHGRFLLEFDVYRAGAEHTRRVSTWVHGLQNGTLLCDPQEFRYKKVRLFCV